MARGLHGPCALWNSKLSGSPWYGKTLDGAHCVRNLWRGALQGAWLGFSVLMVPQFTDIHAKTAGRALWRVLASSPVLEPKQGVTLPPWKTARAVHLAHLSRLLREQSYPVSADAREVATYCGEASSRMLRTRNELCFPHAACWGCTCRLDHRERMQAHLEGAPWPAQGCHLELSDALLFIPVTQKQGPFVPIVICWATMPRQSV